MKKEQIKFILLGFIWVNNVFASCMLGEPSCASSCATPYCANVNQIGCCDSNHVSHVCNCTDLNEQTGACSACEIGPAN